MTRDDERRALGGYRKSAGRERVVRGMDAVAFLANTASGHTGSKPAAKRRRESQQVCVGH